MARLFAIAALVGAASAAVHMEFERMRVPAGKSGLQRRSGTVNVPITNAETDVLYLINVTVGTPPQALGLLLDTGSSDLWVPSANLDVCSSGKLCQDGSFNPSKSSSFQDIGRNDFSIQYVDGTQISGDYFVDTVTIGGSTLKNFTMGLANSQASPSQGGIFQGILGVGLAANEAIAGQSGGSSSYPNLPQALVASGATKVNAYSLWLNSRESTTGSILFGGVDSAKYNGPLTILPVQNDAQSGSLTSFTVTLNNFAVYGNANSTQYSQKNLAMPVVLDSGTTLTYLPDNIANAIVTGVGAVNTDEFGVVVPCSIGNTAGRLNFGFGDATGAVISVPISEMVLPFPPGTNPPHFRNNNQQACLWGLLPAGDSPNLLGDTFLRSAYVVYDLDSAQIGIASTNFNATGSNVQEITAASSIPGAATTITASAGVATGTALPSGILSVLAGGGGGAASTIAFGTATSTFDLGSPTGTSSSSSGSSGSGKKNNANTNQQVPSSVYMSLGAVFLAFLGL